MVVQRDLRAAKDLASSSAAHAAGVQANQQELQQLQVLPCCLRYTVRLCMHAYIHVVYECLWSWHTISILVLYGEAAWVCQSFYKAM